MMEFARTLEFNKTSVFLFLITIASILLSIAGYFRASVINPDGICYLLSAETINTDNLKSAMHLCSQANWPFYSILISSLVSMFHISYLNSAFILNGIFSLISVLSFVYVTYLLGGRSRVLWLAAIVILLAHEFNLVREYIIRDHGFWCFYLFSIAALLNFLAQRRFIWAFGWSISLILASLFRIEGVIFLALLPLTVFVFDATIKDKLIYFLQLNFGIIFIGAMLYVVAFYFFNLDLIHNTRLAELTVQIKNSFNIISSSYLRDTQNLAAILSPYSAPDSKNIFLVFVLSWFVYCIIKNLSLLYFITLGYGLYHSTFKVDKDKRLVLWAYVLINCLIALVFILSFLFLSKRYLVAISLVLMLWLPFALDHFLKQYYSKKLFIFLLSLAFIANAIGGIIDFGYSKKYLRETGLWLKQNISPNQKVYTNNFHVMYYSELYNNTIFIEKEKLASDIIQNGAWKNYDYLALYNKKNSLIDVHKLNLQLVTSFANNRNDRVVIYKVKHS